MKKNILLVFLIFIIALYATGTITPYKTMSLSSLKEKIKETKVIIVQYRENNDSSFTYKKVISDEDSINKIVDIFTKVTKTKDVLTSNMGNYKIIFIDENGKCITTYEKSSLGTHYYIVFNDNYDSLLEILEK